jgi:hypothetical protein
MSEEQIAGHGVQQSQEHPKQKPKNPYACPRCNSYNVEELGYGRRVGGAIGTVAGATGGAMTALLGARTGAAVGAVAGPVGAVAGGVVGALLAGLTGATVGGIAGSALGDVVDRNVLDDHHCLNCDHTFSVSTDD